MQHGRADPHDSGEIPIKGHPKDWHSLNKDSPASVTTGPGCNIQSPQPPLTPPLAGASPDASQTPKCIQSHLLPERTGHPWRQEHKENKAE